PLLLVGSQGYKAGTMYAGGYTPFKSPPKKPAKKAAAKKSTPPPSSRPAKSTSGSSPALGNFF
ncbi:DNA polymerase III subunit epsilon, partial [Paenibacillus riograndensis]